MPHTREHDNVVDNSPMANTETQGTGYTPARDMATSFERDADRTSSASRELARETAEKVKERADEGLHKAAEGVHVAAERLRERAQYRDGVAADAGVKVADTIDRGADYLRDHDSQQLFGDVKAYVREHPMQAVAGAIVGGLLLGKFFF